MLKRFIYSQRYICKLAHGDPQRTQIRLSARKLNWEALQLTALSEIGWKLEEGRSHVYVCS